MEQNNQQPQDKDRHLDIPSEANQDKHINFLDVENSDDADSSNQLSEADEERQRQWREGIEAGKQARRDDA
ncbi:hypothetical protein SAMN05444008_112119 [Cnuella takakiae]|uniref:Uncharacterized protein n=1 Tax=Cnuella takakiae TaxID=1302690 RepID=A0A1M5ENN1_9BACT|nr:hypothetical protein [Cnuella takakiae]OLY91244.1 hypothetical protein BUE76_04500 [Cnuella takakiae]SHF80827.1 hypothetical protein SAMN05444008_112119 [Cnuella takakiae]